MKAHRAAVLGWGAIMLAVAATVALGAGVEEGFDLALYSVLSVVLATTALLILRRHPGQGVGLLFFAQAGWLGWTELADAYGNRARVTDLPGGEYGEWVISWSWIGDFTIWGLILMVFPTGTLVSLRWRALPWVLIGGACVAASGYATGTADAAVNFTAGENPLAVAALPGDLLFGVGMAIVLAASVACVASLVVRFRRARGVERQQLKWFAVAAGFVGLTMPFAIAYWTQTLIVQVVLGVAFLSLPVAAGLAILRYRLYDIDVVIRRTLVYAVLTASLAASTLAAAALFVPARRRIQDVVDRRFFRSRYDAQQTLEAFGARLRDEVDLAAFGADLRAVAAETLQPAHVSLWVRP